VNAAKAEGGESGNDENEQARKAIAASAAAATAAAASFLASAQPASALEHPLEGGWRHGLRPRRHLRAMGDFERDMLLKVRKKRDC